jgi:hypothetical protein
MSLEVDTRGVGYTKHLDETLKRGVYQTPIPNMQFLYRVDAVKDSEFNVGDRVVTPDGRKFRYCLSSGRCDTFIGNQFGVEIPATGIDYSSPAEDAPVGQDWVKMTNQGVVAQTLDGLRGGRCILSPIPGASGNHVVQQRNIVGNTAGDVSDVITVYFDAPLVTLVTAATGKAWATKSMYSAIASAQLVGTGVSGKRSFIGYAAAPVSASGLYHWEQTWGEIAASLYGAEVGKTQYHRDVVFRYDGNLEHRTAGAGDIGQRAGFIMDSNVQDNGATVIYLQIID